MRSLGKRLDAAVTAMYWHVENKDNLVRLATDTTWGEIGLPDSETADWRSAAEAVACGMYAMITPHPWIVQAQSGYLLHGPNKSRHDDRILAIFENAGFADEEADRAAASVFMFVLGNAVGHAADVSLNRRLTYKGESAEAKLAEVMSEAIDIAKQYPRLLRRIENSNAATGYNTAPDSSFEFGLGRPTGRPARTAG